MNIIFEVSLDSNQPTAGTYDIRRTMRYRRELDLFRTGNWIPNPPGNVSDAGNIFLNLQAAGNTVFSSPWTNSVALPGLLGASPYVYSATGGTGLARIRFNNHRIEENPEAVELYQEDLRWVRSQVRSELRARLLDESSSIAQAAEALDDVEAVLDAYISIARPGLLESSAIARAILRGATGSVDPMGNPIKPSEVGLRSESVLDLIDRIEAADTAGWADPSLNVSTLADQLLFNLALLQEELVNSTDLPNESAPYFRWALEELKSLRDHSDKLAIDDSFETHRAGNTESVLDNDIRQLRSQDVVNGQVVASTGRFEVDTGFGPGDPGYVSPSHGQVTFNADGTFTYTPDAGYIGQDRFTYRALCDITTDASGNNGGTIAYSAPAWVVLNVTESCLADVNGDGTLSPTDFTA